MDSKLHRHFNLPDDIISADYDGHVKNLARLWRTAIGGHDVVGADDNQELNLERKLPKITAKSYLTERRKQRRENATKKVWSRVTKVWKRLAKRKLKARGRTGGKKLKKKQKPPIKECDKAEAD